MDACSQGLEEGIRLDMVVCERLYICDCVCVCAGHTGPFALYECVLSEARRRYPNGYGCWKVNLEEQQVLLLAEPSLSSPPVFSFFETRYHV